MSKAKDLSELGGVIVTDGSNVGIGTSSPLARLDVESGTGNVGFNYGTLSSPDRGNLWYDTDGTGWRFNIGKVQSGSFTSQITIQDNGNVGIGTSSPSSELTVSSGASSAAVHVYTQLEIESASHSALQFSGSTGGEQWIWFADDASSTPVGGITYYHGGPYMGFRVEGSERMRITDSGRVGINTSALQGQLHVKNTDDDTSPSTVLPSLVFNHQSGSYTTDNFYNLIGFAKGNSNGGTLGAYISSKMLDGSGGATGLSFGTASSAGSVTEAFVITSDQRLRIPHENLADERGERYFIPTIGNRGGDKGLKHKTTDLGDHGDPDGAYVIVCPAYDGVTVKAKDLAYGTIWRQRGSTSSFNISSMVMFHATSAYNGNEGGGIQFGNSTCNLVKLTYSGSQYLAVSLDSNSASSVCIDIWHGITTDASFEPFMIADGAASSVSTIATFLTSG